VIKKENKNNLALLLLGIILFVLIVSWPIIFFGFSIISFYKIGLDQLSFFALIEIILIFLLVFLWKIYKNKEKRE